jgi:hypothetical protein
MKLKTTIQHISHDKHTGIDLLQRAERRARISLGRSRASGARHFA